MTTFLQKQITKEGGSNCVFRNFKIFLRLKTHLSSDADQSKQIKMVLI